MPSPDRDNTTRVDSTDARAGSREGVVRWVLLVSLTLAIVALTAIWVTGALTQGPVESEGTSEGRQRAAEEERDQGSSIDGINPEVGDSFSTDEDTAAGTD